jgi:predicted esterase
MGARRSTFMVHGKYDPTFLPELTGRMLESLRRHGAETRTLELPVGHYSLELPPFSYIAGYRMITYFLEALG